MPAPTRCRAPAFVGLFRDIYVHLVIGIENRFYGPRSYILWEQLGTGKVANTYPIDVSGDIDFIPFTLNRVPPL